MQSLSIRKLLGYFSIVLRCAAEIVLLKVARVAKQTAGRVKNLDNAAHDFFGH